MCMHMLYIHIENEYKEALKQITTSSWYKNNEMLQAYIQNEWLDCKLVSTLSKYILC